MDTQLETTSESSSEKRHVVEWNESDDAIEIKFLKAETVDEEEKNEETEPQERAEGQVSLNSKAYSHGRALIEKGNWNANRDWSFSPEDGDRLVGDEDYDRFASMHLGKVGDSDEDTKGAWRYPYGKLASGKEVVFRSALTAIRQRSAQMKQEDIYDAAGKMLDMIDKILDEDESRKYWDGGMISRAAYVEPEEKEESDERLVRVAFASEEPVERSFGFEILSHDAEAIDREFIESGRAPVLTDHDASIDSQIGVVESVSIDATERKSRAVLRFSKESDRADQIYRQILEGTIQNISVGYYPLSMTKTEEEIDGRSVHIVDRWSPREISVVAIPADWKGSGVGRSQNNKEVIMETTVQEVQEAPQVDEQAIRARMAKDNKEIQDLAIKAGRRDLGDDAVGRGVSLEAFRGELCDAISSNALPSPHNLELSKPEKKEFEQTYSLCRAVASQYDASIEAPYEKMLSDEIARKRGRSRGLSIPDEFWRMFNARKRALRDERELETRVLTSGGATSGTQFVPVPLYGSEWISALRAKMIMPSLGVKFWEYRDKFSIPRVDTGSTVAYVSEGSAGSAQTPTTGKISFTPYPITAYVDISREMMMMGDPQTDQWVAEDLSDAVAALLQSTIINGDGSSKPTGILQTSGIGDFPMGTNGLAPTWASVVGVAKEIEIDNAAINDGTIHYLTNFKVKAKMSTVLKDTGSTGPRYIYDTPFGDLFGQPISFTTSVPSNLTKGSSSGVCSAMIYGDFSQGIVNLFGGTDILVDPYSQSSAALTRVVIYQDNDFQVRHAQSFSAIQDYLTT